MVVQILVHPQGYQHFSSMLINNRVGRVYPGCNRGLDWDAGILNR